MGLFGLWCATNDFILLIGSQLSLIDTQDYTDQDWMSYALSLADKAEALGEIPVGAVLVKDNKIIGEGWNVSIIEHNACSHAEIVAIGHAGKALQNYRLIDCTLYVTLEPCPMCAGAIVHARIKRLVYGAGDYKTGAAGTVFDLVCNDKLNHQVELVSGVYAEQCANKISDFFKRRRKEKKALKRGIKDVT
jgi:tRNA(adenine34) deaminase